MILDVRNSFAETLALAKAEQVSVEVHLRGGSTVKGRVSGVSEHSVVIDPLAGKDFFGAQIRIADIVALSVQIRGV